MIGNDAGELLPCPFCGGVPKRITLGPNDRLGNEGGDVICCTRCEASSHVEFGRKENLVSRWNTRAQPASAGVLGEALIPSAATKAAYIGEFDFNIVDRDEDGDEIYRRVLVPWDTIKEIMAAIAARQALSTTPTPDRFGEGYRAGVEASAKVPQHVREIIGAATGGSIAMALAEASDRIRSLQPATGGEA